MTVKVKYKDNNIEVFEASYFELDKTGNKIAISKTGDSTSDSTTISLENVAAYTVWNGEKEIVKG